MTLMLVCNVDFDNCFISGNLFCVLFLNRLDSVGCLYKCKLQMFVQVVKSYRAVFRTLINILDGKFLQK